MSTYPMVLIPARISKGGFGNERTYTIRAASGGDFTGLAAWLYCFDSKMKRVKDEPASEIEGYVQARIVNGAPDGPAKISLPDGEVCYVARSDIRGNLVIPPKPEIVPDVPV